MTDFSDPRVVMPAPDDGMDDGAETDDPRLKLCLPLVGEARQLVAWLTAPLEQREAIAQHHRQRFVELSQMERQVLDDINAQLPENARIMPFSLLPPAVWESELEARLMSWGLVPVHPYLNMYLPQTEAGNAVLHLPSVPQAYHESYSDGALREIRRICAAYAERCAPAPDAAANECAVEDWLQAEEELRLEAVEEILMLAEFLARRLLGNEIVERHEGLFGSVMKRAMGFPAGLLMHRV